MREKRREEKRREEEKREGGRERGREKILLTASLAVPQASAPAPQLQKNIHFVIHWLITY